MAATILAGSGLRTCVIEKAILPRPKACGGLMPGSVSHLSPVSFDHLIKHRVSRMDFSLRGGDAHGATYGPHELFLVDRAEFDGGLIELAISRARGDLKLLENALVTDVQETENGVHISGKNFDTIQARGLIAADGASSLVARRTGLFHNQKQAVAFDVELAVPSEAYHRFSKSVYFDYFIVPAGYGWIFPKQEGVLSCGIGSWDYQGNPLQKVLNTFLSTHLPMDKVRVISNSGYPIPVFSENRAISTSRICLTGDAAGLVDPVSGEGIRYALHSGKLAAEAILAMLTDEDGHSPTGLDCATYSSSIRAGLGKRLENIHQFVSLPFHQAPDIYYRKFIVGGGGQGAYQPSHL